MRAVLIDPYTKATQEIVIRPESLIADLRQAMGLKAPAGMISQVVGPGIVLWLSADGLLEPDPKLWHTVPVEGQPQPQPVAGRAVVIGCDPNTGQLGDVPVSADQIAQNIVWRDDTRVLSLGERWRLVQSPQGLLPIMERVPVFGPAEDPTSRNDGPQLDRVIPSNLSFWVVATDTAGEYEARKYRGGPDGVKATGERHQAADLDTLYAHMGVDEETDRRVPADASDHPSVVETWLVD